MDASKLPHFVHGILAHFNTAAKETLQDRDISRSLECDPTGINLVENLKFLISRCPSQDHLKCNYIEKALYSLKAHQDETTFFTNLCGVAEAYKENKFANCKHPVEAVLISLIEQSSNSNAISKSEFIKSSFDLAKKLGGQVDLVNIEREILHLVFEAVTPLTDHLQKIENILRVMTLATRLDQFVYKGEEIYVHDLCRQALCALDQIIKPMSVEQFRQMFYETNNISYLEDKGCVRDPVSQFNYYTQTIMSAELVAHGCSSLGFETKYFGPNIITYVDRIFQAINEYTKEKDFPRNENAAGPSMRAAKERLNKLCCLSLSNGDSREVAVELMQKGIKLDRLRGLLSKIEPDLYQNINPTAPVNENTPKTYQAHRL